MGDLINRSELIAQLEGFKLSLGDVILGFVKVYASQADHMREGHPVRVGGRWSR